MSSMFIKPPLFPAHQPALGERLLLPAVGGGSWFSLVGLGRASWRRRCRGWALKRVKGLPGRGTTGIKGRKHDPTWAPHDRARLYLKSDLLLSPFTPNALGGMQWEWWASILRLIGLRAPSCYLG